MNDLTERPHSLEQAVAEAGGLPAPQPQSPLQAILEDPAQLREFPVETVERLFALHERQEEKAARAAFNTAFHAVQSNMTPVEKAGRISYGSGKGESAYAKAEHVAAMLYPLLDANGFTHSVSESPHEDKGMSRFTLTLRHVEGHTESHDLIVPTGAGKGGTMNPMQAMASTYTYVHRHLLCKVFGVVLTGDDDGQAVKDQATITEAQATELAGRLTELGRTEASLCRVYAIDRLEDLPAVQFDAAVALLRGAKK